MEATFNQVLLDLKTALHCHGCGTFVPFGVYRYQGEYCSKGCFEAWSSSNRTCALIKAFGACRWCTEYVFQPHVPSLQQCVNQARTPHTIRLMRALDAFLEEHDSLPYTEQYTFRTKGYMLYAADPNHEAFVAQWYWMYVFGVEPCRGTLPAHWLDYKAFMPLPRRVEDGNWPFYDSCYSS